MFCNKCGKEMKDGAKFCPSCGAASGEVKHGSDCHEFRKKGGNIANRIKAYAVKQVLAAVGAFIGFWIGAIIGYFFQSQAVRTFYSLGDYLRVVNNDGARGMDMNTAMLPVIICTLSFIFIGIFLGERVVKQYFPDGNSEKKWVSVIESICIFVFAIVIDGVAASHF